MSKNFFSMGLLSGLMVLAKIAALVLAKLASLVFRRPQEASFFPCRFLYLLYLPCTDLVRIFAATHNLMNFSN